jgi:hypothetical protein
MTTSEQVRRLEALEAEARLDAQGPLLARLATNSGISVGEILSEASRVEIATAHLNYRQRLEWIAADAGMTVAELEAEADALLADDPDL